MRRIIAKKKRPKAIMGAALLSMLDAISHMDQNITTEITRKKVMKKIMKRYRASGADPSSTA